MRITRFLSYRIITSAEDVALFPAPDKKRPSVCTRLLRLPDPAKPKQWSCYFFEIPDILAVPDSDIRIHLRLIDGSWSTRYYRRFILGPDCKNNLALFLLASGSRFWRRIEKHCSVPVLLIDFSDSRDVHPLTCNICVDQLCPTVYALDDIFRVPRVVVTPIALGYTADWHGSRTFDNRVSVIKSCGSASVSNTSKVSVIKNCGSASATNTIRVSRKQSFKASPPKPTHASVTPYTVPYVTTRNADSVNNTLNSITVTPALPLSTHISKPSPSKHVYAPLLIKTTSIVSGTSSCNSPFTQLQTRKPEPPTKTDYPSAVINKTTSSTVDRIGSSRNANKTGFLHRPPPTCSSLPLIGMDFNLPPLGASIEHVRIHRSDRNLLEDRGLGFVYPTALYTTCPIEYRAPGWLSDPRFKTIFPRLQSGMAYICTAQTSLKKVTQKKYFLLLPFLAYETKIPCISILDTKAEQFVVFAPLNGVSEKGGPYMPLYKRFLEANKESLWIPLTNDKENNLFFLVADMPERQHEMASKLLLASLVSVSRRLTI